VFESVLESSSSLSGVLFNSQAFPVMRWTMPGKVLIEVDSWGLYLAMMPSHVGG
jgi:hypothetical protein